MTVSVFTLGCKTNLYESGQIVAELNKVGYNAFLGLKKADIFVLNTCAITAEAEKKSRQLVARARRLNPNCRVIIVGCASEKNSAQFVDISNVTLIKGVADKTKVVSEILNSGVDVEQIPSVYAETNFATQEHTRAFVKIQDGCNNFCSYCIVPYLRGRSRSRKIDDIVSEVKQANAPETVLIGIDISQFGNDNNQTLSQLFDALADVPTRLRFGSLEARVISDTLLKSLSKCNFCPHFHLSLQSGCDSVLSRMNRKYTTEQYFEAVNKIRKVFPDAAITTDIIVGFCGETDDEFNQTVNFAKKVQFADIHVFPYSPREGTVAYNWTDVDAETKKKRAAALGQVKLQLKNNFANKFVGTTQEVLCEQKTDGYWDGYTRQYLRVYFSGNVQAGQVVKVKIIEPYLDGAKGELL